MEETIEARVSPEEVWQAWERAHAKNGALEAGQQGRAQFQYKVLNVQKGESFSILWKTFFVRLIFSHHVKRTAKGSAISYKVQIKGPFAWPVRWLLGAKIKQNIGYVLKAIVKELEQQRVK
jgi:hypothetical protein